MSSEYARAQAEHIEKTANDAAGQIRLGIARCNLRIAEMCEGKRGVRTGRWCENGAGLAYENELRAQETTLARLELELVMALLPKWGARRVLDAMEPPPPPQIAHGS